MRHTSFGVSPIRDHAFFEQAQFERLLGNDLLQGARLTAQVLYLVAGRRPCRVTRQPTLASFEELLRPDIIKALSNALTPTQLGNAVVAAQTVQHDPDLVFSREVPPRRSADVIHHPLSRCFQAKGFWSHLRSLVAVMRPKSSFTQYPKSVS